MTDALRKPRVHSALVETLATKILNGEYAVGTMLPTEPELCLMFGVSRSSVREATRILAGKGLVAPRPRTGTAIRPRDDWNMLDAELLGWAMGLEFNTNLAANLTEARQAIEPAAARLAALRATARDLAEIEDAYHQMARATGAHDVEAFIQGDIAFHSRLLKASHNIVFQQLSVTVGAALAYTFRMNARRGHIPEESLSAHAEVLEHIRMRDPESAAAALSRQLGSVAVDISSAERDL
jgi:GntR family transcriptional regulator, galactonate operon transcriptional repressor